MVQDDFSNNDYDISWNGAKNYVYYNFKYKFNYGKSIICMYCIIYIAFANISRKKVTADFTGEVVTSDFGVLIMREVADKI